MKKYIDSDNKMLCIFDIVLIVLKIVSFVGELSFDADFYSSIFDYIFNLCVICK